MPALVESRLIDDPLGAAQFPLTPFDDVSAAAGVSNFRGFALLAFGLGCGCLRPRSLGLFESANRLRLLHTGENLQTRLVRGQL